MTSLKYMSTPLSVFLFLSLSLIGFNLRSSHAETLREQLQAKEKSGKADPKAIAIMDGAIEKLRKSKITERAKKVGDRFPGFTLKNANGATVSLDRLLEAGPVIVTFYRGSWCPYCNIQLMEYQKHVAEWEKKGAKLVALSPEIPELSKAFAEKRGLTFDLVFDKGNAFATQVGIVFGIESDLKQVYAKFGVDLAKSQGNSSWQLPIAATYVIGKDHKVKYAFVDPDYKKRAEPSEIDAALEQ
jgi:peroxiredoxin